MARRVKRSLRAGASITCLALALATPASAQTGLLTRLPLERRIAELSRPEPDARIDAARALAVMGPAARVVPALAGALAGEAVPEARAAIIEALARRGGESAVSALVEAWDRAAPAEREHVLDGLVAIGTEESFAFVLARLANELHGPGVCVRLGWQGDSGVDRVAARLSQPEQRDVAVRCLAQLADSTIGSLRSAADDDRAVAALVGIAPTLPPEALGDVLEAIDADPRAVALAASALDAPDSPAGPRALAVLARHAPDRVPIDRWRALASEADERGASAIVALAALDPPFAQEAIAGVVAAGGARASAWLGALAGAPTPAGDALAPFVALETTRSAALDRLASLPGGADVLARLPAASDVALALAIAAAADPRAVPTLRAHIALLDPAAQRDLLAVAGALEASACTSGSSIEERRRAAYCLYRAQDGGRLATRSLESEREPSVVAWLSLATDEAPSEPALHALLELERARPSVLHLVPSAMARATPPERRRLSTLLARSLRSPRAAERAEAIAALGDARDSVHRALLALALEDDVASVRIAAARALSRLDSDPVTEIRRAGRARIEHDADVRRALAGVPIEEAVAPLHLRVDVRGESPGASAVEIELADGHAWALTPVNGEILLFGVPDREAHAVLLDPERD